MNKNMMTVAEIKETPKIKLKRFRVEDFYKMTRAGILPEEHGWEVIDGRLVDKMTIGTKYTSTVKRLNRKLTNLFNENEAVISIQDPIHIDEYNEPEPDIALLKPREDFYEEQHAIPQDVLLLIEVSDSTIEYDREIKKNLYAEAGIVELWIVNLQDETVECYSQLKNGQYRLTQVLGRGEKVESNSVEKLELTVDEILGL
jgi:Uma2 family endonuclease